MSDVSNLSEISVPFADTLGHELNRYDYAQYSDRQSFQPNRYLGRDRNAGLFFFFLNNFRMNTPDVNIATFKESITSNTCGKEFSTETVLRFLPIIRLVSSM
jgi:hypothetical protein